MNIRAVPRAIPALLVASLLFSGCDLFTGPRETAAWTRIPLDERVTDAYTGFGFELFRQLRAENPDANLFASPTSAAFALTMTYNGAVGQTAEEMALALGVGHLDRETLNATNRTWLAALRQTGDPRVEMAIANSIWHVEGYPILDSFRERVRTDYDAEVRPITTAADLNAWVSRATRGRIDRIVDEIPITIIAYLINALYFKADWTHPFDERKTRSAPFHRLDGSTVQVPMMSQEGTFDVRSDEEMHMLRLPYGAGRFSMILAQPRQGVGGVALADLGTLAERLEPARWRQWMTEFQATPRFQVQLPRFEVEWESSLIESLRAMGMEVPFDNRLADFSPMFGTRGPAITEVLQKTYLRVDEKGTEAAAATNVNFQEGGVRGLTFDRPFFLAIYDHATETVLFLGQITDPTA